MVDNSPLGCPWHDHAHHGKCSAMTGSTNGLPPGSSTMDGTQCWALVAQVKKSIPGTFE